jgi:tripartite-type tricarboxylate transporter receptor subunit TctC
MRPKGIRTSVAAMLAVTALAPAVMAQDNYPSRDIEIVTPFGPGGSTDTAARLFAAKLGQHLPNNPDVVVVNKPGGATTIGMTYVAQAEPDGYTISLTSNSPLTIQPIMGRAQYTIDSFTPIIQLVGIPQMLMVQADAPWKTYDEWSAWVEANPGKFTYATPGNGTIGDIAMAVLGEETGLQMRPIPYESGGKAQTAMLGGNVDGVVTFQGNVDPAQVNMLLNFSPTRSDQFPDIPTMEEMGYTSRGNAYIGIVGPAGMDPAHVRILHDAFKAVLEDPEIRERLFDQFYQIAYEDGATYGNRLREDSDGNEAVLRRGGMIQ